jgi:hypothetical protein
MVCKNCGLGLQENAKFCTACGATVTEPENALGARNGRIGYSKKITDPDFAKYIKKANSWSAIFSVILAAAAVIGFYIYGESGAEMDNPQALYIGLGIGGMFILIALFSVIGRKRSRTWDGIVVDKQVKVKRRKRYTADDRYHMEEYTEYTVSVRQDNGKMHSMSAEDDDTVFNYWQVGDRLRRHGGLNSYEKYDKSQDSIIFCSACATLCDINDEYCGRCKCPLLK